MSEAGDRPPEQRPPQDPTAGGSTAFGATNDPWARPVDPPAPSFAPPTYADPGQPTYGQAQPPQPPPGSYGYGQPPSGQASYGQTPYGQTPYGPAPYGQPQYGPGPAYATPGYPGGYAIGPQNSSKATTVMVLGIAGVVLLLTCGIGIVPAVISLAMSGGAKREIEESGGRLQGLGMVTAARITSWITVGLFSVGLVVLAIGMANSSGGSSYNGF